MTKRHQMVFDPKRSNGSLNFTNKTFDCSRQRL